LHLLLLAKAERVINRDRFDIKFADDAQAQLFSSSFAKYGASIRSSIGGEPTGVEDTTALTSGTLEPQVR
jgi:hypothetical protein